MKKKKSDLGTQILVYGFMVLLTIISFMPFYIMIINSTRSNLDILNGLSLIPGNGLAENYEIMMKQLNIWRGFRNSLTISIPFTLLSAYFGALTAYGFAIYNFKGKKFAFDAIVFF